MTIPDVRLELMTSPQIAAAIEGGMRTVIVPFGAVEQHGPHLPLSVDADHADRLAVLIAARLGNTLVAPTMRVGCSEHHMDFTGTISLSKATFESVCREYCISLARHGFTRILLFSGHFGNFPVLADALPRLRAAVAGRSDVEAFVDSRAVLNAWRAAVADAGGKSEQVGGHADLAETSIMLVLRPGHIDMSRAQAGRLGVLNDAELSDMWRNGLRAVSASGVLGDPRGATARIGEACLEAVAALMASAFAPARAPARTTT
jgi:creatinine amidohydrolase